MENKKYWTIGGVALILVGAYIVYNKLFKGGNSVQDGKTSGEAGGVTGTITGSIGGVASGITNFLTNYNDYVVTTQNAGLNVRTKPDANSKVITTLPSGSTIKAKVSGTKGWMGVSLDGRSFLGYVSQNYLKIKQK